MAWEAPIIIHFKVEDYMLSKLFLDAHYKNLFETGASNGNKNKEYRQGWEVCTMQEQHELWLIHSSILYIVVTLKTTCMFSHSHLGQGLWEALP